MPRGEHRRSESSRGDGLAAGLGFEDELVVLLGAAEELIASRNALILGGVGVDEERE